MPRTQLSDSGLPEAVVKLSTPAFTPSTGGGRKGGTPQTTYLSQTPGSLREDVGRTAAQVARAKAQMQRLAATLEDVRAMVISPCNVYDMQCIERNAIDRAEGHGDQCACVDM